MQSKYCIVILLFLHSLVGFGQTCTIQSDSFVCLDDFIGFQVSVSGGTASSWSWKLGDNQSSVQQTPFAKYGTTGIKTIEVTVTLSGGGTCQASKNIFVHALPVADFVIDPLSNFCFSKNNLCIINKSLPAITGASLDKDIILWGDGDATHNPNSQHNNISCHKYGTTGKFTVIMEITDSKGCRSITQKDITILPDLKSTFIYYTDDGCEQVNVCFKNTTPIDSSNLKRYRWSFSNGIVDSVNWSLFCNTITHSSGGALWGQLMIETKDGCVDSVKLSTTVNPDTIIFDIIKDRSQACINDASFVFEDKGNPKDQYAWYLREPGEIISLPIGTQNPQTINASKLGVHLVSLTVFRNKCKKTFFFDSVEVIGPLAKMDVTNASLCTKESDSTYFCDKSDYYKSFNSILLWDFGDFNAPSCTTDTRGGLNIGKNCRYSRDKNPAHIYTQDTCYNATLTVEDTVTGCKSTSGKIIQIGPPNLSRLVFKYANQNPCTGSGIDRRFNFNVSGVCNMYYINPDSADPSSTFKPMLPFHNYMSLSDPSGDVTVGIILKSGEDTSACAIPLIKNVCYDTIWLHKHYNIMTAAVPDFSINTLHGCAPLQINLRPAVPIQQNLIALKVDWGDGDSLVLVLSPGDTLQDLTHIYPKNGSYTITYTLTNSKGCQNSQTQRLDVGHFASVKYDTSICAGVPFFFEDSVTYFSDSIFYWRIGHRLLAGTESLSWNFGDGGGFTKTGPYPFHIYAKPGRYNALLVTGDSAGCFDTLNFEVKVRGIDAGIKQPKSFYLCSEIMQLFDSSVLIDPFPGDRIQRWAWDFGDGSTPSYLQNPFHYYSTFGEFTVRLIVRNSKGCTDTAYTTVNIRGPEPLFNIVSDSVGCAPLKVEFDNVSNHVKNWIWYFGDPANTNLPTVNDSNVFFTYTKPGTYYIYLYGADSVYNSSTGSHKFCSSTWPDSTAPFSPVKKVVVLPISPVSFVVEDTLCIGEEFFAINTSDPKYKNFMWDFGDTTIITDQRAVKHSYNTEGIRILKLKPILTPDLGLICPDSSMKVTWVTTVNALFEIDTVNSTLSMFRFKNLSAGAARYEWDFGQPSSGPRNYSSDIHPFHNYAPDKGIYEVCLKAYSAAGCVDSFCLTIENSFETKLVIPNVFTPDDNNKLNDAFDIDIDGEENYSITIFNRWGQIVFESDKDGVGNDGINWNGKKMNEGAPCPDGAYYVIFRYKFYFEEEQEYNGTVTLIR